jgi:hypothetical protein
VSIGSSRGTGVVARRTGLALWVVLVAIVVIALVIFVVLRSTRARHQAPNVGAVSPTGAGGIEPVPTPPGTTPVVIKTVDPTALNRNPPLRPDPTLTPGDTLPVTKADICVPGYSKKVRNVPSGVKKQAYARYGIAQRATGEFEVDHLISLELGGSNSIRNLWPESYMTHPWNAHVKDVVENALHKQVCDGTMSLHDAQRAIASDWIAAYRRLLRRDLPPPA